MSLLLQYILYTVVTIRLGESDVITRKIVCRVEKMCHLLHEKFVTGWIFFKKNAKLACSFVRQVRVLNIVHK